MRIHLKALGCRLNEAELETWASQFQAAGHHITSHAHEADVVVLNTCAVTEEAVRKSRRSVRRFHRDNPTARLILTGCYATLSADEAASTLGVDLVVDNADKARLVDIAARELDLPVMPAMASEPGEAALFARGRERAFVKIQDGCRYRCTFCIVTVARGEERSRAVNEIVAEVNLLRAQGINEIVLTGVHAGGYGGDIESNLYELVRSILADTDVPRLRLGSVEPWDLPHDFFELFDDPRMMPHLHLPLQSGSDTVLRRMARRCKTREFERLIERARASVTGFNVTTDIIVGFPGESDDEWRQTLAFVEHIGFGHLHIFPYSSRTGTKAASLPGQVSDAVKKARSRELHALSARMKRAALASTVGDAFPVLWEGSSKAVADGRIRFTGYTPNYFRVAADVPAGTALGNTIRVARVKEVMPGADLALTEISA